MNTSIFVIYDGIHNSVFVSQVLSFIESTLKTTHTRGLLVTFEKDSISTETLSLLIPKDFPLDVLVCKKIPFIGKPSLWYATWQLKKILHNYNNYSLFARGPLAGFICINAKNKHCHYLTIQARGLLAEEYGYTYQYERHLIKRLLHNIRKQQFLALEKEVYSYKACIIEAVSPALKEYLINTFKSKPQHISIAEADIPKPIDLQDKKIWRAAIRKELNITDDVYVYCYNGSLKPWQCPTETLEFFKTILKNNTNVFLLMLTQDLTEAQKLLIDYHVPIKNYALCSVKHTDIYRYLAACDAGIVLRKPHIINWVSRPTKILEYQALNLPIIHNNTVEYLKH